MNVLVFEREGEWANIQTDCSNSIAPTAWVGHDRVFLFSCAEKPAESAYADKYPIMRANAEINITR
jgi:hypothetical protein